MPTRLAVAVLLLAGSLGRLSAQDVIFDLPVLVATPLYPRVLKSSEHDGIVTEQVQFHSERDGNTDVEIFAFFSYAKGAHKLPAFIWNPGGLGQASPAFTEPGAKRGYAVLCIDFPQPGYRSTGNYPINTGLTLAKDPRQSPIYHGAVALLKAVSYLESRPEVDKDRIGMAGSSWGGFFTTLMVGIDGRLKAGACLYGTGNLHIGNAWWDGDSQNGRTPPPPEERERWRTTLDPAFRLPTKNTPIAWFTGTNDRFYLLPSVMMSYEMARGPRHLTLVPNWDHAMSARLTDEMYLAWLDVHLKGKQVLPTVTPVKVQNAAGRIVANWEFDGAVATADLIASYGAAGNWKNRYWHTFPAKIDGHSCHAALPAAKLPSLISGSVVTKSGLRASTPLLDLNSKKLGVDAAVLVPDYDGTSEWGGFEESQMAYLARHNRSGQARIVPRLSNDAREGTHSAILETETTVLPPILSTADVPHRFTCALKADKPVNVAVQLAAQRKLVQVGTSWTEVAIDHTPPNELMGGVPATITIPAGATVLLDAVHFHPVAER